MEKLTRTAKRIDTVLKALFWILIASGIIAIIGLVLSFVMHAVGVEPSAPIFGIELDFISLELATDVIPAQEAARLQQTISLVGMVSLVVGMVLGAYCIRLLRSILRPMKEAQPFHEEVSVGLKKLAWVELIGGGILSLVELAMENLIIFGFNLKELLVSDKISAVTFNIDLDLSFLIAAAVCFLLSYIFRYGEQLQTQADETL